MTFKAILAAPGPALHALPGVLLASLRGRPEAWTLGVVFAGAAALALLAFAGHRRRDAERLARAEAALAAARREVEDLRRRLTRQERLTGLGMLAAGVAHEINNPMSYVTANVQLLARALRELPAPPAPLREFVDEVIPDTLDGIDRVNTIVSDLRRFAREEPGAMAEFDLNQQVQAALRISRGTWRGRVEVAANLGRLPPALGNAQQITQVLVNLLVNAAQAIPGQGLVTVQTRCTPDCLLIEVRDTGVGMSPETLSRIFQPFFTTKPAGVGTGLGLAVAHGIVRSHGGRILVQSQLGEGSTFTVELPRRPPSAAVRPPEPHAERALA